MLHKKTGYVYILSSHSHTTLYTGVTSNLVKRIAQHKSFLHPKSFSARYNCTKLVYYAIFETIMNAIIEEKRIKGGSKDKIDRKHEPGVERPVG